MNEQPVKRPKTENRHVRETDLHDINAALWKRYRSKLPFYGVELEIFTESRGYQGRQSCDESTGIVKVEVLNDGDLQHMVSVLVHEWGHVLTWAAHDALHGPLWGVAYAEVFRYVYEQRPRRKAKRK